MSRSSGVPIRAGSICERNCCLNHRMLSAVDINVLHHEKKCRELARRRLSIPRLRGIFVAVRCTGGRQKCGEHVTIEETISPQVHANPGRIVAADCYDL